jgi:hypothetical protein
MLGDRAKWVDSNLWILIPTVTVGLASIAVAFGVDSRLASIFALLLFVWPLLVRQEGPSIEEDPEYGYLRNIRVRLEFTGLLFQMVLNAVVVAISILISPILIVVGGGGMVIIYGLAMTRERLFHELRGKNEMEDFKEMFLSAGGSVIYLGFVFLQIDLLLLARNDASLDMMTRIIISVVFAIGTVFLGWTAWLREIRSRKHARALADSLRKRRWRQARKFQDDRRKGDAS